jgi:hypothetical protein
VFPNRPKKEQIKVQVMAQDVLSAGASGVGVGGRYRDVTPKKFLAAYGATQAGPKS